jgi:putative spermidine/putrescine transport system substrate-binding protein
MPVRSLSWLLAAWAVLLAGGCNRELPDRKALESMPWEGIVNQARGTTVNLRMWDGDPLINAYMRDHVARELREQGGVQLVISGGSAHEVVTQLAVDLDAGRRVGDIDLVWINGENFYQLRQLGGLYGPFTERLPNNRYLDWDDPFIAIDFQQPVQGYECPWGSVQFAMIHDSVKVPDPPRNMAELAAWVRQHPGRFTFDNGFTGLTFLKGLLYELAGDRQAFAGKFNADRYAETSARLWDYLHAIRPYLWRRGETLPEGVAQLHQLMNNGEVDFSMSNNDGEVDNKVAEGILPPTARGYVFDFGTIRNAHYLGIPYNAANIAGAMVVANYLISPPAQLRKALPEVWGDGTVLATRKLPADLARAFSQIPGRARVPTRDELAAQALMEPAPELMIRLSEDLRAKFLESQR